MGKELIGKFHSKETFGTVDGPGIRYVAFMQGCALRCRYCHNPDTWLPGSYSYTMTVDELVNDVKQYRNFIRTGGVTFSGGEPLLQHEFVTEAILRLKEEGFGTALDTCGYFPLEKAKTALLEAEVVMLDIKAIDSAMCTAITGQSNENALKVLRFLEDNGQRVWIRHVLLPGFTLMEPELRKLADFLKDYKCIECVELLPFHKMGEFKWEQLNLSYSLKGVASPAAEEVERARRIFTEAGIKLH